MPILVRWAVCLFIIFLGSQYTLAQQEITVNTTPVSEALEPGDSFMFNVVITNDGDAPLTWSAELQDVFGRGTGVSFTKADFANWLVPENQDRISDYVWIARNDNQSIFNAKSETSSDNNAPAGTEWALGLYNDATGFDTFKNMHGGDPQSLIGETATLHDISDNEYYELDFSAWTGGNSGGGFAYTRHKMYEYISIQTVVAPIDPGMTATITVVFDTEGLASDMFESSLVIFSDDTDESEITIPITLEVLEPATFELSATSFSQTLSTGDDPVTQTLTISNNGSSVLFWSADEPDNRPDEMSGVTLSSYEDQVVSTESQDITITFADDGNNAGMYEWPVTFYSNDPDAEEVEVLVSLEIVGTPSIDWDEVDPYESTFVGTTRSGSVTVYNEGTAPLEISNISSSTTQFIPTSTTLSIEPGEREEFDLLFSPDATGTIMADITITSNDPETPSAVIPVSGEAVDAPAIEISQLAFSASLSSGDDPVSNNFIISNTGMGTLEWNYSFDQAGVADPATATAFAKASNADETLPENQDRITENVWLTREDHDGIFNAFEQSGYNGSTNTIEWALGRTEDVSADDYTNFKNALDYNISGRITNTVLSLHLIESNRYFDVEFDVWESGRNGGAFSYTRTEVIGMVKSEEVTDPIAAGESLTFDFSIDASRFVEGEYQSIIRVTSNDPLEETLEITVDISVSGTPNISVEEASVETEVGSTESLIVPISNIGLGDLTVSNVTIDEAVFGVSETSFVIPGNSTYDLELTFSPTAAQSYPATLSITSDDPDSPTTAVSITGNGLDAPTIDLSSIVLSETLAAGEMSSDQSITISNTGLGLLEWEVSAVRFEKGNYVDYDLPENQDRIHEDIWITRRNSGGLTNRAEGDDYWIGGKVFGQPFDDGGYSTSFLDATDDCGSCVQGNYYGLYLPDHDEYYNLFFDSWTSGDGNSNGGGGGVSYVRRSAVPWVDMDIYEGTVDEGTNVVNVSFNASGINAGNYEFTQDIVTNDPANPSVTITFMLEVTGTPNLSVSEGSTLNLGDQFVGEQKTGTLIIDNNGSDVLDISNITFDDVAFTIGTTELSILPGEYASLDFTFAPTAEQAYMATGTITSNDPETTSTFSVNGTGIAVPDITIDVSSISAELLSGGLVEKSFVLTNNGTNAVNWSIEKIMLAGTEEVLFEKADFADWTLAENQDRVTDNIWITRADRRGLFNAAIETEYTSGDRRRLVDVADVQEDQLVIGIPIEGGSTDPFDASPKGTLWASNPTFNLIEESYRSWRNALPDGAEALPGNTLSMWAVEEDRYFDIEFLSWTSGGGCCGDDMGGGFSYRRYETVTWLNSFSSTSGPIDSESFETVTFNMNADGVSAGDYDVVITISDGLNTQDINVSLTVLGLPEILVEEEALDFGPVFVGTESTESFEISNTGLADLEISSITADNAAFTVDKFPSNLGVDESGLVEITFAPNEVISYSAVLTITNNDGTNSTVTVDLSGMGQNPPELNVDKTSMDEVLFFGASASQTFTISNTGDADLEWNLGLSDAVEFSKADFADWTLAENQDRITDNVWITRADSKGIFNIAQEDEFEKDTDVSPIGTLWASGATGNTGRGEIICCVERDAVALAVEGPGAEYSDWRDVVGGSPSPERTYSMYLTQDDLYFDVVFTSWTEGNEDGVPPGGGFSYTRTPIFFEYQAVSFSQDDGVIAPGESQVVTVFFNPSGTYEGRFELPLQVQSNDPNGPADILISMNVNGILVENPIDDQLVNEGFGTSMFDISSMFVDAQNDPLTYAIESSDGTVASGVESGGMLTITEVGIGTTTISITAEDGKGSSDTFEFEFRVNAIPVVSTAIEDQSYEDAFGSDMIDLSAVFSDADADDELDYTASTSADGVVDVSVTNGMLTITEVGPGTVNVTVTANDGFGGEVSDVFEVFVNKINQTITFDALTPVAEDIGTVQLTATASSNLTVTYESSNTSVATVSGSTLTILADGQTTITASQAGDAEYNAATSVDQVLVVDAVLSADDLETVAFYPNPVNDFLSITNKTASKIEIYHLDGKLVLSQEISEKADLSKLNQGVYLVKLMDKEDVEIYSGRLVKN